MAAVGLGGFLCFKRAEMKKANDKALLPAGLHDGLPPEARHEARAINALIGCFAASGYERIKPPLVEFEESLLSGPGAALAGQTFRLMDPVSQRMMGVRADMTPQVARIVSTRLAHEPRPLRLCYAGQVLRVSGSQLRPERQFAQAGVELVGSDTLSADLEVVLLAVEALSALGVSGLSVDLTLPALVPAICREYGLDKDMAQAARNALDAKDAAALAAVAGAAETPLPDFLAAAGEARRGIERLRALPLGAEAKAMIADLAALIDGILDVYPDQQVTIDPGEYHGFEYQSGISFTLFARGVRGELGRGGRYVTGAGKPEPACGFTLYMDTILRALPRHERGIRLYVPHGVPPRRCLELRRKGWRTLAGLEPENDPKAAARKQGCQYVFLNNRIISTR